MERALAPPFLPGGCRIVDGDLLPGARLRDADIAFEFGVSRMPVREALRRLEDEGLVQAAASRWTRVSPLDIEEARRLHSIVSALEALAVRLIGSLDEVLIDRLEMTNEGLRVSLAKGDPLEAWRADEHSTRCSWTPRTNP